MLKSRVYALVGAGALATGLSFSIASPAAADEKGCQAAVHDHAAGVPAPEAAKACKQAAGGDTEGCVGTLTKAGKGKVDEGAARAACIAAQY